MTTDQTIDATCYECEKPFTAEQWANHHDQHPDWCVARQGEQCECFERYEAHEDCCVDCKLDADETTDADAEPPRIYVASLSDYNAGRLHGVWIDATQGGWLIHEQISAMLRKSTEDVAEEWAIHDYEGFEGLSLNEFEDVYVVGEIAQLIAKHGVAFAAWYGNEDHRNEDIEDYEERFEDAYQGKFDDLADYAQQLAEDSGDVNFDELTWPLSCIDWNHAGRELVVGGDIWASSTSSTGTYIFRNV